MTQFQSFDKNNDGVLSKEEILEGYTSLYGEALAEQECVSLILNKK
jgi:Ca2+-binding EF-hand superfamily protein